MAVWGRCGALTPNRAVPGSHEVIRSQRDRSRMYFARRLRQRRITIRSLSEKVNHIWSSVLFTPIDPGYLDALECLGTSYYAVDSIQHSDEQPDFNLLPDGHHGIS